MTTESTIEIGLDFRLDSENRKLIAICIPCENRPHLTVASLKEYIAKTPFASFFVNDYLAMEFLHRYKDAPEKETFEFEIGERRDATCEIQVAEDKFRAWLNITPNFGGKELTLTDIQKALAEKNVTWGLVDTEQIKDVLAQGRTAHFLVAEGLLPVAGVDSSFVNLMPQAHERKPHVDADGNVDYRELGDIPTVREGQVLMKRIPAIPGQPGFNILGEKIEPTGGTDTPFTGDKKGVYINPENSDQLLSAITGQPIVVPNGIIVSPVLTLTKIDFSTGNIRFDGSIVIKGDVKEGMKVYALEDITVDGDVTDAQIECMGCLNIKGGVTGNSELIANGEINIKGGVQGTLLLDETEDAPIAKIASRSSIIVGFVENYCIEAAVDIVVDKYSLNSQLTAGNKIVAGAKGGKKSSLMGGTTWAMTMVKASIIGAPSGIKTHVQVGSNPYIQKRIHAIRVALKPNEKEQQDIHKILAFIDSHPEKGNTEILEKLHHTLSKLVMEAQIYQAELRELVSNLTVIEDAKVIAERGVYSGSEVQINSVLWKAQENRSKSVFRVEKREMTINSR